MDIASVGLGEWVFLWGVGKRSALAHSNKNTLITTYLICRILDVWDSHRQYLGSVGRRVHISLNSPRQTACKFNPHDTMKLDTTVSSDTDDSIEDAIVIFCHISERLFSTKESYRLTISDDKIRMVCSDLSGLHYCIVTLVQLFRLFVHESKFREENYFQSDKKQSTEKSFGENGSTSEIAEIIPVYISDCPDCASRAVLLDLNPFGRVPKKVNMKSKLRNKAIYTCMKIGNMIRGK